MEPNRQPAPSGYAPSSGYGPPPAYGSQADGAHEGGPVAAVQPAKLQKVGPGRTRTGLVVLFAFVLELVVIVGYGNQGVTDHVRNNLRGDSFTSRLYIAGQTFSWRFSPPDSDFGHRWLAQLMLPVSFLVLSALLIAIVVRGSVTFFRAFFATWGVVLLATLLASYVRGAIASPSAPAANRADSILFVNGSNSAVVLAGLALGFVVAFVVAVVTAASRRPAPAALPPGLVAVPPEALPDPDQPPPYFGVTDPSDRSRPLYGDRDHDRPQTGGYLFEKDRAVADDVRRADASAETSSEQTSRLPAVERGADRERGTSAAAAGAAGAGAVAAGVGADEQTTRLPAVDHDGGAEPAHAAATRPAERAVSEPAAAEPAVSDRAVSEPAVSDRAVSDRAVSEPAVSEPAVSDRAVSEPAVSERGDGATTQLPRVGDEPYRQPRSTEPPSAAPSDAAPADEENPTTRFPTPPDDDDLHGDPDLHR